MNVLSFSSGTRQMLPLIISGAQLSGIKSPLTTHEEPLIFISTTHSTRRFEFESSLIQKDTNEPHPTEV